jgi:hypothetical protein
MRDNALIKLHDELKDSASLPEVLSIQLDLEQMYHLAMRF